MANSSRFSSSTSVVESRFEQKPVECLVLENGADILSKKEINGRTIVLGVHRRNLDGLPTEYAVWSIDSNGGAHTGEYSRELLKAAKAFEDRQG